jgi:replicative DNA helicase
MTATVAKPLPSDHAMEFRLLACIYFSRHNITANRHILDSVPPETFAEPSHRAAWTLFADLAKDGALLESEIARELPQRHHDGAELLNRLANFRDAVSPGQLARNAATLRKLAHRRELITELHAAAEKLWYHEDANPEEIGENVTFAARAHAVKFADTRTPTMADHHRSHCDLTAQIKAARSSKTNVEFGIVEIDARAYLVPSYGVVLARTSVGKTAFAANVALHNFMAGRKPAYFTMEDTAAIFFNRLVSLLARCNSHDALGLGSTDVSAIAAQLAMTKLSIFDGRKTPAQIFAACSKLKAARALDMVFVDQLSRLKYTQNKGENKEQALTRTSGELVDVQRALGVPLILLGQLGVKHGIDSPAPHQNQIKDCSSVLEDADWVMVLDRPEADHLRAEKIKAEIAKARSKGDIDKAESLEFEGRIIISCEKDRNAIMGGIWRTAAGWDKTCGKIVPLGHQPRSFDESAVPDDSRYGEAL